MATPRRAVRAMGESAREVSRKPLRAAEALPSRSGSSESGDSWATRARSSAPASRKPLSPSRPAGVGPRARPSRSDGDAGGTGSVVSKAMKSPSPLSEFRFSCAKRFSPLACFPAPAPVSSALGLRRTTRGLAPPSAPAGRPEVGGSGVKTTPALPVPRVPRSAAFSVRAAYERARPKERPAPKGEPPSAPSLVPPSRERRMPFSVNASRLAATRRSKSAISVTRSISSAAFSRSTEELRRASRRTNTSSAAPSASASFRTDS